VNAILAKPEIDATLRNVDSASSSLDRLLADPGLKATVDNTSAVTDRLRKLAESGEVDQMVKSIDDLAQRLDAFVGDNQYDVRVIVQDLRVTADNLRTLSATLKRYPAGALIGGPPERLQLPGKSP
jgi:ABC-type transporter Mla subunit MlaD